MVEMIRKKLGLHGNSPIVDCVMFPGCKSHRGYGLLRHNGKLKHAHRVSYEIFNGNIPEGAYVCHKCDNRACVNPDHLFIGSHAENMEDMIYKGRQLKGQQVHTCKLTPEQVIDIKKDVRSQRKIAAHFGISKSAVGKIKRQETWIHL